MMQRDRLWKTLLTLLCCGILLSGTLMPEIAFAADSEDIRVRVGYYENEVFQEGAQEGAVKYGYAYEYYQKLSEYTGWKYEYVYGDFSDLYQMLLDGEIDFAPMGNESYNLVKHDVDDDISIDPAALSGKKIGVLDSAMVTVLQDFLDSHSVQAEIVLFRDYEPLFAAFDSHEIDVLAAEGDGAYGRAHAELLYPFGASDYYLCVSKSTPELLEKLNEAQTELSVNEPNYINSLRSKYYPVTISSRTFSEAEKQWLSEHTELRVGYLNNYLPYSGTEASGSATGLVRDLVPRMLESLNIDHIQVTFIGYDSYDEMIASLGAGEIDTAFPVGGGMYYSEKNGIFQTTAVVSTATQLVHNGEYTENTTAHFAVRRIILTRR